MSKSDEAINTNDNAEANEAPVVQPTLDELHESTIRTVEADEAKEAEAATGSDEDSTDEAQGDKVVEDESDKNAGDTSSDTQDDETSEAESSSDASSDSEDKVEPVPVTDTKAEPKELTGPNPDDYKTKFVGFDGKEYLVNSAQELPDDFEPKSYKAFLQASQELSYKQSKYVSDKRNAEVEAFETAREERLTKLQNGWDADITTLTKKGVLPKDEKARKEHVEGTFAVMEREMKSGRVIDSFDVANRLYRQELAEKADADRKAKVVEDKKKRGAMVQGSSNSNRGSLTLAPKSGTTLDELHESLLQSVN